MIVNFRRAAHEEWISQCRSARERGTETHGYLLGMRSLAEVIVTVVLSVGTVVEEAMMTRPDYGASAVAMLPYLKRGLVLLGEVHKHPDGMPAPSSGDRLMLLGIPRDEFPGYLCLVTSFVADQPVTTAHSVRDDAIVEHPVRTIAVAYPALLPESVAEHRILQLGAGSGASLTLPQTAKLGVKQITIVDHDLVEPRNVDRHFATRRSIGKPKARVLRDFLRERSTARIHAREFEITARTIDRLDAEVRRHTLIINGTGHPLASLLISRSCARLGKPCVHAGAFARGSGGFVFVQVPGGACYECLYGLRLESVADDAVTMTTLTKQYGYSEEELRAQVGLWTDVNMIAAVQSKVVLDYLKFGSLREHLWLVDNLHVSITKRRIANDTQCVACNGGHS